MTRISLLIVALVLSIACVHAQTQCGEETCKTTEYCFVSEVCSDDGMHCVAEKECTTYQQQGQDCTQAIRCAAGLKCDLKMSSRCVSESTVIHCTTCGLKAGSNGPCCAPALGITPYGDICYCPTSETKCFSNSDCKGSDGCCNTRTGECTSDSGYC